MASYSIVDTTDTTLKLVEDSTEIIYKKVYCSTAVDGDYLLFYAHDLETGKLRQQYEILYSDCVAPSAASAALLKVAVDVIINSYSSFPIYSDIYVGATGSNPADAGTVYFGQVMAAPGAVSTRRVYFRRSMTIIACNVNAYSPVAGSNEAWSLYIRLNNTTDTLVQTLSVSANERIFLNTSLNIAIVSGDYIEMKLVNPTWATNPTGTIIGGYLTAY